MEITSRYEIVKLQEHGELAGPAAQWFHQKWGIPKEAYDESIAECLQNNAAVPQWYVVLDNQQIIAGAGVIENDFHDRRDLTPNVCAVYVEKAYRCQAVVGRLLSFICEEFYLKGMDTLYLVTDHTSFYERYGWEFFCMVSGDGDEELSRMYVHKMKK